MRFIQWNANSVVSHSAEFKLAISNDFTPKPDVICVQETWLTGKHKFFVHGYETIRRDRDTIGSHKNKGGGCMTLVKQGLPYRVVELGKCDLEVLITEVYNTATDRISVVNIYNPCLKLDVDFMDNIMSAVTTSVIVCGDFNGHNFMWGSLFNDVNGVRIEDTMDSHNLVCINTGSGTRIDGHTRSMSCLDLTWTSHNLAAKCNWCVLRNNWGSDHFPIMVDFGMNISPEKTPFVPKWSIKRACWDIFQERCAMNVFPLDSSQSINVVYNTFITQLNKTMDESIPKTKPPVDCKNPVPWWNEECNKAVREKKKALNAFRRSWLPDQYIIYKKKKAIARKVVLEAKRNSWKKICESITPRTSTTSIWKRIKSISNCRAFKQIPCLSKDDKTATVSIDKANMLVDTFANTSSTANYDKMFQNIKIKAEREFVMNDNCNDVPINDDFNLGELQDAISKAKCTTPGADGIGAAILKKLPKETCSVLLDIINLIWARGECPTQWKEAILMPILKPGRVSSSPLSFRPIALTSTICKIMERMVTSRLDWYLDLHGFIPVAQSGFRKGRRTIDHLTSLESSVHTGFCNRESTLAIFLDLEKAYDMVWRKGVLIKLQKMGLGGRLIKWLNNFLSDRIIRVKVNGILSNSRIVENGVPQGSVISPILFNVSVSDLPKAIDNVKISQFADDIVIWKTNRNIDFLAKQLQFDLDNICDWCKRWGFKLSASKSNGVLFTRSKGKLSAPLKVFNGDINLQSSAKFLGLIFDARLNWNAHVDYIIDRCKERLNILRCISGCKWGANCKSLLILYKALIRPILEYGCEAFDSASQSVKSKLNSVQFKALRICTGALSRTSLVKLQVECGEPPLQLRRTYLNNVYSVLVKSTVDHPCRILFEDCWQKHYFKDKVTSQGQIPFGFRNTEINHDMLPQVRTVFPYWYFPNIDVHYTIHPQICGVQDEHIKREVSIRNIHGKWKSCLHIYTDGSVDLDKGKVGCGVFIPEFKYSKGYKLPSYVSIFSAELVAIYMALLWVSDVEPYESCIFSDSLSALQALKLHNSDNKIVCDIRHLLCSIRNQGIAVHFDWVPSHCGIFGNEGADAIAKRAAGKEIIDVPLKMNRNELKRMAKLKLKAVWQQQWETVSDSNSLKQIHPVVGMIMSSWDGNRRNEVVFHRLRMGFGRSLNHYLYIIGKHPNGLCDRCLDPDTVTHLLLECLKYGPQRDELKRKLSELNKIIFNMNTLLRGPTAPFKEVINFLSQCRVEI